MPFSQKKSKSKLNGNICKEICSLLIFPGRYLLLFSTLFITNYERKLRRWNTEGVRKTLDHPPQGTFSTNLSPSCTKHDKLSYSGTVNSHINWNLYGARGHRTNKDRQYKSKGLGTNSNLPRNARWVLRFFIAQVCRRSRRCTCHL